MLHTYLFFHCNLAFSSIEAEQRAVVIDRCYAPMLDLPDIHGIPIGVEATGWTLEKIAHLRPQWIERLKCLLHSGKVEFIGSGYAQIIGPLIPASVNSANQRLGLNVYEHLLNMRPKLALVNEQAYSAGILEHYADNGYSGIIMEWDNPHLYHPEWPEAYRYAPQCMRDMLGRELALVWNQTVVFQHLQRLAHGEIDNEQYASTLNRHCSNTPRALCLYGNDAEIFDFRPGRFETEAPLCGGEWERLTMMLAALAQDKNFSFCLPGVVPDLGLPASGNILRLESPAYPVPVKKQPKYNLLRWAVTGRDDTHINTRCHALARCFAENGASDEEWRELCYLWSSDFRTHITDTRWKTYLERLDRVVKQYLGNAGNAHAGSAKAAENDGHLQAIPWGQIKKNAGTVVLHTDTVRVTLNTRKGLAIESAIFPAVSGEPLFGTLPHGFFGDIAHAADFFTGHVVMEIPGQHRYTDLAETTPQIWEDVDSLNARAEIAGFYCPLKKNVSLSRTASELSIRYSFAWQDIPAGSVRLLHLTLNPDTFDTTSLFYATHNGGCSLERYALNETINHGAPVSFMISAGHALGMTEGLIILGDKDKELHIRCAPDQAGLVGMIAHRPVGAETYTRLMLTCREFDETVKAVMLERNQEILVKITCALSASIKIE
jgi:hypothetical protein